LFRLVILFGEGLAGVLDKSCGWLSTVLARSPAKLQKVEMLGTL